MPMAYPDVLTNAAWQKKKGLFARATKETGIGASLTALEKAFRASTFAKVDPQVLAAEMTDPLLYMRCRANLGNALKKDATVLRAKVKDSQNFAAAASATFAKDSDILLYLSQLIQNLVALDNKLAPQAYIARVITDLDREFKAGFSKTRTAVALQRSVAADTEKARRDALAMIKQVEKEQTVASIHDTFGGDGPHRVVSTTPKLWDQVFRRECPLLAGALLPGLAMNTYFTLPWISDIGDEAGNKASDRVANDAKKSTEARAVTTMTLQYGRSLVEYKKFTDALAKFTTAVKPYS
jgi:hypothetical protein